MILYIRTDSPTCMLRVGDTAYSWEAGRGLAKGLMGFIEKCLHEQKADWHAITGIVVFAGPGSFTGLRIGAATANALAYAQNVPIVGVTGEEWQREGASRLQNSENDTVVLPAYGREARITQPRK